jgi:hypothetical protein
MLGDGLAEKNGAWAPTLVKRVIKIYETSTWPAEVETDAGPAFLKARGNPEGHML